MPLNFPQLIKATRKSLGETQEQFAKRFDTHANTISRYETGEYDAPYKVLEFVLLRQWTPTPELVAFLYVMLRDHLPAGTIEQVMVEHVGKGRGKEREYSNRHLAAYARELAVRLMLGEGSDNA